MTVIAMTREMGSLGKDVAAGLADEMELEVVHHELVERHLAERLALGESAVHLFLEGKPSLWERWKIDPSRLSRLTSEEVLLLAKRGNVVIRGWGAAQLLRHVSHVVCVRVCAPMPNRIAVIQERMGIPDRRAAEREIERNDDAHSRAIQRQFGEDWRSPLNYDIVLNTGFVPVETCVALVRQLAESPSHRETDASRGALADKLIEARVRTIVDADVSDNPMGSGLDITVVAGKVTLSGVTGGSGTLKGAMQKIAGIEGVVTVEENVLRVNQRFGV